MIGGAPPAVPATDEAIDAAVRQQFEAGHDHGPRQIADVVAKRWGAPPGRSTRPHCA